MAYETKKRIYTEEIGIKLKNHKILKILDPLLESLGAWEYKSEIFKEIEKASSQNKEKKTKFSKIIQTKAITYYYLKEKGYPMTFKDVSNDLKTRQSILKYIFVNFPTQKQNNLYIKNLTHRIVNFLESNTDFKKTKDINTACKRVNGMTQIPENIIAILFDNFMTRSIYNEYKLTNFCFFDSLKKICDTNRKKEIKKLE